MMLDPQFTTSIVKYEKQEGNESSDYTNYFTEATQSEPSNLSTNARASDILEIVNMQHARH